MGVFVSSFVAAMAAASASGADVVAQCREAHANTPEARIACLEGALLGARPASAPDAPPAAAAPASRASLIPEAFRPRRQEAEEAQRLVVRIVSARYGADGLGQFVTADGQTWRETVRTPARQHLSPAREYEAVITQSPFGGFRMNVTGVRREMKVEPLN